MVPKLALSSRNDPSRRSLNIIGCSGSGPVRADPALGNGGYGDGTPHPGAPPGGGPHPHAPPGGAPGGAPGDDPPGGTPQPDAAGGVPGSPDGRSGGSQGGGGLVTAFLSSALARIVTRPHGPVNGVRDVCGEGGYSTVGRRHDILGRLPVLGRGR